MKTTVKDLNALLTRIEELERENAKLKQRAKLAEDTVALGVEGVKFLLKPWLK